MPRQVTRAVFLGATRAARGCLRTLVVPGYAGITKGDIVRGIRENRESLTRVVAFSATVGDGDGDGDGDAGKGFWTPKNLHEAVAAASQTLRVFEVDVRARTACVLLSAQLNSPIVVVRHLEVRAGGSGGFGAEDKARLWRALGATRKTREKGLRKLTLAGCGLNAEDIYSLVAALSDDRGDETNTRNTTPLELDVGENPLIGCSGAAALAKAVANGTLGALRVEKCGIGDAGAAALGDALGSPRCGLTSLLMGKNFLGETGVTHLVDGLVRRADYSSSPSSSSSKPVNPKIKRLDLSHNALGCLGAYALERCARASFAFEKLEFLNVANNGVGPAGAAALARGVLVARNVGTRIGAPNLKELRLEGNPIGAAGARAVARASVAVDEPYQEANRRYNQEVNTANAGLDVEGVSRVEGVSHTPHTHHASLTTLGLGSARLGVAGAAAVAWAIAQSGTLRNVNTLDLSANNVGESGAALSVSGRDAVFGGVDGNVETKGSDEGTMDETRYVFSEDTRGHEHEKNALASLAFDLASAQSLRRLDLGYNALGCVGACVIAEAVASRRHGGAFTLDLRRNGIGDGGACALAFALSGRTGDDESSLDFLSSVDLRSNAIGEAGLVALQPHVASGRVVSNYMPTRWTLPRTVVCPVENEELIAGRTGGIEQRAAEVSPVA